ncbi:iron-sulfur cluster assembly enzyme ISCU, mitochondrial isoform X2 [Parus major]|uniref:iron-sulfur cluster assembly enzyme ISCU, mitochondrial isoform X2 n=1 Tax=Parus major TaxID=9157 RepID=UPI001444275E|nr:iron-sulfur cluster assembly enzyme ISCU, mitochondrial isoform X2 [Parus major]
MRGPPRGSGACAAPLARHIECGAACRTNAGCRDKNPGATERPFPSFIYLLIITRGPSHRRPLALAPSERPTYDRGERRARDAKGRDGGVANPPEAIKRGWTPTLPFIKMAALRAAGTALLRPRAGPAPAALGYHKKCWLKTPSRLPWLITN